MIPQPKPIAAIASPVATLRLLALAEDLHSTMIDEPEQLVLPLEWARLVPRPVEPEPTPVARPEPAHWGGRIILVSFEIMLGRRPAGQLARLVDPRTLQVLSLHASKYAMERRTHRQGNVPRPRVTSVRSYQPHTDAAEICAVVHDGTRYRAVAMRLVARGNQWMATAFEMG